MIAQDEEHKPAQQEQHRAALSSAADTSLDDDDGEHSAALDKATAERRERTDEPYRRLKARLAFNRAHALGCKAQSTQVSRHRRTRHRQRPRPRDCGKVSTPTCSRVAAL